MNKRNGQKPLNKLVFGLAFLILGIIGLISERLALWHSIGSIIVSGLYFLNYYYDFNLSKSQN